MRIWILGLLLLALTTLSTYAAVPPPTYADLEYAVASGISLRLDLYIPPGSSGPFPVVVWIHGGGWMNGDKASPTRIAGLLDYGIAVASINYRLSGTAIFPAQIYDCKAAIRWLRAHASQYNLDPNRFGTWGTSAGGHLAALVGTSADVPELEGTLGNPGYSSRVQAVVDYWGPTDFLAEADQITNPPGCLRDPDAPTSIESCLIGTCIGDIKDHIDDPLWATKVLRCRQANPITWVSADDPPFFIRHGDMDTTVPSGQSQILHNALLSAGVDSTYEILAGKGHSTTGMSEVPAYEFFRTRFGLPPLSPRSINSVKMDYEDAPVKLDDVIVSAKFTSYMFVEQQDRSMGIRVNAVYPDIGVGDMVDVDGAVRTITRNSIPSERYVVFQTVTKVSSSHVLQPLFMTCKSVGGETVAPNLPGVLNGAGLNNIGLLVSVIGEVKCIDGTVIYVDDGSHILDSGSIEGVAVHYPSAPAVAVGDIVRCAGIVEGNVLSGASGNRRFIRARDLSDFLRLYP